MKIILNDYLVEKGIGKKDYRTYEIEKFLYSIKIQNLEKITFTIFHQYMISRQKNLSYSTVKKINSLITSFLFWVATKSKNYRLLTDLYTDKSILTGARKKKNLHLQ